MVEKAENISAISLSENIKASMHPADEFVAFQGMVDGGKHGFVMLAESDDTICGICTVSFVVSLRTRGVYGIVQEMYILPELRGQRIGAKMLISTLEYAQSVGCIMVEVGTPPEGSRQSRFYKGVGFKRFGDRYRYKFDK